MVVGSIPTGNNIFSGWQSVDDNILFFIQEIRIKLNLQDQKLFIKCIVIQYSTIITAG